MRTRLPILLGLVLLVSAVSYAATLTDAPAAPVTSSADQTLAADPFLTLSDITSSAPEDRAVCPCQLGVNCCGDGACFSAGRAVGCGVNCACRCKTSGQCVTPPSIE